ncbi:tim10/DDP family zinc finger domain-containing protein [Trichoderma breve]|uniref:Mitochondrial import inner membrane translocase subunit n=2 Tax=Trichoderma TaxID=5543 RepID=A0A9W9E7D2_9HYPO|nr:tim10/DDP family zinc finger domain-containing protein [Trichoderma breve]KAJ4857331.1 tim10/DDP family zinc finger domain-containing protein [Trichoderma breve]
MDMYSFPLHIPYNPLTSAFSTNAHRPILRLTSAEQRTLEQRMQKRQVKEFVGAFGGLVEHCFTSCVDDFTSKSLSSKETGCLNRCVLKWMATQQRVSERFQEHNAQITQQMQK